MTLSEAIAAVEQAQNVYGNDVGVLGNDQAVIDGAQAKLTAAQVQMDQDSKQADADKQALIGALNQLTQAIQDYLNSLNPPVPVPGPALRRLR